MKRWEPSPMARASCPCEARPRSGSCDPPCDDTTSTGRMPVPRTRAAGKSVTHAPGLKCSPCARLDSPKLPPPAGGAPTPTQPPTSFPYTVPATPQPSTLPAGVLLVNDSDDNAPMLPPSWELLPDATNSAEWDRLQALGF